MPPGIMGRRPGKHRRNRRMSGQATRPQRPTPIGIVSVKTAGDNLTIEFDQPVSLKGVPQFVKAGGFLPTGASLTAPTTLLLTYTGGGAFPTGITIPYEDPAVRNSSGGFVTPSAYAINTGPASASSEEPIAPSLAPSLAA